MINNIKFNEIIVNWEGTPGQLVLYTYIVNWCSYCMSAHNSKWSYFQKRLAKDLHLNVYRCGKDLKWLSEHGYITMEEGTSTSKGHPSTIFTILRDVIGIQSVHPSEESVDNLYTNIGGRSVYPSEKSVDKLYTNQDENWCTEEMKSVDKSDKIGVQNVHYNKRIKEDLIKENKSTVTGDKTEMTHEEVLEWVERQLDGMCKRGTFKNSDRLVKMVLDTKKDVFTPEEYEYINAEYWRIGAETGFGLEDIERKKAEPDTAPPDTSQDREQVNAA